MGPFINMKSCIRDPIPEIYDAAILLDLAVDEILRNQLDVAEELLINADNVEIRNWTESIWGANSPFAVQQFQDESLPSLMKDARLEPRMPSKNIESQILNRDGFNCSFCGIPVISQVIRKIIHNMFPTAVPWGKRNADQHAAFQAMWLQFDHVLPHSRGGATALNNMVITCAPCNYGRMERTTGELGILNPLSRQRSKSNWDGLERLIIGKQQRL
jgi:5-methylcytosine-specific restriction endonuclease McrA